MNESVCFIINEKNTNIRPPLVKQGYAVYHNEINFYYKKIISAILKRIKLYWRVFSFILWKEANYTNIAPFTYIVVISHAADKYFCSFIEHHFPSKQLIIYFVSTIRSSKGREKILNLYKNSKWHIYSFDEQECSAFQLRHNPLFFCGWGGG
jgi:hypothetical protein